MGQPGSQIFNFRRIFWLFPPVSQIICPKPCFRVLAVTFIKKRFKNRSKFSPNRPRIQFRLRIARYFYSFSIVSRHPCHELAFLRTSLGSGEKACWNTNSDLPSCFMFHVSECSPHLQFLDNAPEVRPSFYLYPGHFALSPMCRPIDFRLHKSLRFVVNFFQDGTHPVVYKWLSHNILPKYDSLIQGNRVSIRRWLSCHYAPHIVQ